MMTGDPSASNGARVGGTNLISVQPPKQSDLQVRNPPFILEADD